MTTPRPLVSQNIDLSSPGQIDGFDRLEPNASESVSDNELWHSQSQEELLFQSGPPHPQPRSPQSSLQCQGIDLSALGHPDDVDLLESDFYEALVDHADESESALSRPDSPLDRVPIQTIGSSLPSQSGIVLPEPDIIESDMKIDAWEDLFQSEPSRPRLTRAPSRCTKCGTVGHSRPSRRCPLR